MQLKDHIEQMMDYELQLDGRAAKQYALLRTVVRKDLPINGFPAYALFNQGRVHSVMADVSPETLSQRKCFLCPDGIEDKQQSYEWNNYFIRVNPFPIFERHFTISSKQHLPQRIEGHYLDMLLLAAELPEYAIFYNGPRCGASAPDHMHFQAVPINALPLQYWCDQNMEAKKHLAIRQIDVFCPSAFLLSSPTADGMQQALLEQICQIGNDINLITWKTTAEYRTIIFFRSKSRPDCFFAEDPQQRLQISPATVEMAGIAILATINDFNKLTSQRFANIIEEVSLQLHNNATS